MSDFYQDAAQRRGKTLQYQLRNAEAALLEAESLGDTDAAANAIQEIADINAAGARLNDLHRQYTNPPLPPQQTPEQWKSKPIEQMNYNDALEVVNYGKAPNDPTRVTPEEYNRGLAKLAWEKSRGNYVR